LAQILNLTSISTLVIIAILVVIEEKGHAFVHKIPKSLVDSKFVGHPTNSEEKSHIASCLHFYHTHIHTHTHTHTHTITHISKELWYICIVWKQIFVVVQWLGHVQVFETPWTAAHQASLSFSLPEFAQIYVLWINDVIWPFHALLSPFACSLSQHQGLFQWVGSLQLQNQSIQWIFRVDFP